MRLQLSVTLGALLAAPAPAIAQPVDERTAEASLRVYADDDHVTVWTPAARVVVPLPDDIVVEAETTIDALTAASIDVTSTASPYAFDERRVEGGLAGRVEIADLQWIGAQAIVSDENDYTSLHVGASWRAEVARRNATVELAYTAALDTVGRAGDPQFAEARRGHRAVASFTQITDRAGYLDVVVDAEHQTGYLASPYRYVPITVDGAVAYALPERVPDERTAIAALARIRRAVAAGWFAHGDYRLCRDTWGVTSHTLTARATRALREDELLVGVEARGYLQDAATFARATYEGDLGAPAWRTRDRSLGAMRTVTVGGVADLVLPWLDARLAASLAWAHFAWPDDPLQRRRDAVITSLALHLPF